jgi:creatinine amidohydrolase
MTDRAHSEHLLAHLAWPDAKEAADAGRLVIVPTGAIEAHGPHLPLDVDTHQAEAVALRLAERISALVAPAIAYGYSTTFMAFSGTVTLSAETYQQVVFEVGASLIEGGFRRLLILNGNRPNGTCNDVAARRLSDAYKDEPGLQVTALSYWEPASAAIHKVRQSAVGGMGHACEFETSLQLALRPDLVHLDRLEGVESPLVGWDLVAADTSARSYGPHPDPEVGHPAIFGDPTVASAEAGHRFLDLVVDALVDVLQSLQGSYEERIADHAAKPKRHTSS